MYAKTVSPRWSRVSALELLSSLLDVDPDTVSKYLVEKPDPGSVGKEDLKLLALPRPRTVNLYVLVEAQAELVIRHEGGEDFAEFEVAGRRVPGILNTKMQAAERRALLRLLYDFYDNAGSERESLAGLAEKLGFSDAAARLRGGRWRCYLAPAQGRKQSEEVIVPYCGFCPSCMIYGFASMDEGGYNVKSRVEGDVFYGLCPSSVCVTQRTFNAVNDITKTTIYEGGAETGALYRLSLIEPGTVFLGKVAVRDPSPAELLSVMLAIAHVERIGGRVTHFGRVKTHIAAVLFSRFERGTSYEAASRILSGSDTRVGLEEALEKTREYAESVAAEGDLLAAKRGLADTLRRMPREDMQAVLLEAWRDSLVFKKALSLFVKQQGR